MRGSIIILGGFVVLSTVGFFRLYPVHSTSTAQAKPTPSQPLPAQAFILPVAQPNYLPIRDFNIPEPTIDAKAAGLYDVKSSRFLYSQNIDQQLPIASITKLMTAVVVIENLNLDDTITVRAEDLNLDGHGADLNKDEQIKAHDLLKLMLIKSSNDAAATFASWAQTKNVDLLTKMNQKAQELGMTNTKYLDAAGLDDNAHSTVRDLVKLTQYVAKYPEIWQILTLQSADIASVDGKYVHHVDNTNKLLGQIPHIIGGKTGYTDSALGTMILQVAIDDQRDSVIDVVLGTNDRFGEIKQLINWAMSAYRWQ